MPLISTGIITLHFWMPTVGHIFSVNYREILKNAIHLIPIQLIIICYFSRTVDTYRIASSIGTNKNVIYSLNNLSSAYNVYSVVHDDLITKNICHFYFNRVNRRFEYTSAPLMGILE